MNYPKFFEQLKEFFKLLPGVGEKTSDRFIFEIMQWNKNKITQFANTIENFSNEISFCNICGSLKSNNNCIFCNDKNRDTSKLCIVANLKDIYLIEETKEYNGIYHVIQSKINLELDDSEIEKELSKINNRINENTKEIIIALDSTIEGDAISFMIKESIQKDIKLSRLAFGVPLGSSFDFVNKGTLAESFIRRHNF